MKRFIVIVSASLLAFPLFGQEKSPQLKDTKDKVSYSIGMQIGFNLGRQKVDINPDILAAGIKDAIAGKPQLTPEQAQQIPPEAVQQLANHAQNANPSIVDTVSNFYAQHTTLVKTLGGAALTVALAKVAERQRQA